MKFHFVVSDKLVQNDILNYFIAVYFNFEKFTYLFVPDGHIFTFRSAFICRNNLPIRLSLYLIRTPKGLGRVEHISPQLLRGYKKIQITNSSDSPIYNVIFHYCNSGLQTLSLSSCWSMGNIVLQLPSFKLFIIMPDKQIAQNFPWFSNF